MSEQSEQHKSVQLIGGNVVAYAIRLTPGSDLVSSMEDFAARVLQPTTTSASTNNKSNATAVTQPPSSACFVLSAVGSLEKVSLRMANACRVSKNTGGSTQADHNNDEDIKTWNQRLEVVSLVGTLSPTGKHLHMSVSDEMGNVYGGHVISGTIYTTLELVFGVIQNVKFSREDDERTGYRELVVRPIS